MKVLNFGSLNIDYVYDVSHILKPGETISSMNMNIYPGGKGLNQSIALGKAGAPVYHAGLVGDEGELLLTACAQGNVDTSYVKCLKEKSGHTIIQVDEKGQNCILLFAGTNRMITKEFVDEVLKNFEKGDILLLQNEINELPYIVDEGYRKGLKIVLNPSPFDDHLKEVDFDKISYFLINEIEGEQMTGYQEKEKILVELKKLYPQATVVLTLGSEGAIYQSKEQQIYQKPVPVKAVDTTAAGDTFTGYFITSIIEEMTPEEGMLLATKAAAIAVQRKGAAPSIPYRKELVN